MVIPMITVIPMGIPISRAGRIIITMTTIMRMTMTMITITATMRGKTCITARDRRALMRRG